MVTEPGGFVCHGSDAGGKKRRFQRGQRPALQQHVQRRNADLFEHPDPRLPAKLLDSSGQLEQLYAVGKDSAEPFDLYSSAQRARPEIELSSANQPARFEQPFEREHHTTNFLQAQPADELQPQQRDFPLPEQLSGYRGKYIHARAERDARADTELDKNFSPHFPVLFLAQSLAGPERIYQSD